MKGQEFTCEEIDYIYTIYDVEYKGKLIGLTENTIIFQLDTSQITLDRAIIKKVIQAENYIDKREDYISNKDKRKRLYFETNLGFGYDFMRSYDQSFGLYQIIGYKFYPPLNLGLGVGLENLATRGTTTAIPIYLQIKNSFSNRRIAPRYILETGYFFPINGERYEDNGGFFIHPNIGINFKRKRKKNSHVLDFGLKIQKHNYIDINRKYNRFTEEVEVVEILEIDGYFKYATLRFGVTF